MLGRKKAQEMTSGFLLLLIPSEKLTNGVSRVRIAKSSAFVFVPQQ